MQEQLNILIVDRDADARECLRDLLEVEGYAAMAAPPGSEALHLVRGADVPCIILLNSIGRPRTGLEQMALLEQETYLLEVALSVLNGASEGPTAVRLTNGDPSPSKETLEERHLFQLAMTERRAEVHPISRLVRTSAEAALRPLAVAG